MTAPVATQQEVAALRGLNDALRLVIKQVEADARKSLQERDEAKDEASTLRARVDALEAALRINGLRQGATHAQIDEWLAMINHAALDSKA